MSEPKPEDQERPFFWSDPAFEESRWGRIFHSPWIFLALLLAIGILGWPFLLLIGFFGLLIWIGTGVWRIANRR